MSEAKLFKGLAVLGFISFICYFISGAIAFTKLPSELGTGVYSGLSDINAHIAQSDQEFNRRLDEFNKRIVPLEEAKTVKDIPGFE